MSEPIVCEYCKFPIEEKIIDWVKGFPYHKACLRILHYPTRENIKNEIIKGLKEINEIRKREKNRRNEKRNGKK